MIFYVILINYFIILIKLEKFRDGFSCVNGMMIIE